MRLTLRSGAPALAIAAVLAAGTAAAQGGSDTAARRALVERAQAASRAGNHAEALDLALRAGTVQMSPSLQALISGEHLALAHYAEALEFAEQCVQGATHDASLRNRELIIHACRDTAAQARRHTGSVVVRVPANSPPGMTVNVAGHPLNSAFYGVPYVVNPGSVLIEATAPRFRAFTQSLAVAEGGTSTVVVALVSDPNAPATTATVDAAHPAGSNRGGSFTSAANVASGDPAGGGGGSLLLPPPSSGPGVGPWIVVGAGALSLGAAVVFFVLPNDQFGQLEALCPRQGEALACPDTPENHSRLDNATTFSAVSIATLGVGIVAVGAGLGWFFATNNARRSASLAPVRVLANGDAHGFWLGLGGSL